MDEPLYGDSVLECILLKLIAEAGDAMEYAEDFDPDDVREGVALVELIRTKAASLLTQTRESSPLDEEILEFLRLGWKPSPKTSE
jgi:hypothetical protein